MIGSTTSISTEEGEEIKAKPYTEWAIVEEVWEIKLRVLRALKSRVIKDYIRSVTIERSD
jgi:hypothetical protein